VNITLAPTGLGHDAQTLYHYLTTYLINDDVAIDAGSLGFAGSPAEQTRVRHVFLSHSHIDHVASLPIFLENVFDQGAAPVTVYGSAEVLDSLQRDVFNDRLWPDFIGMSRKGESLLRLHPLVAGQAVSCGGLSITPVPVHHSVPTFGFIVEDAAAAVVMPGDTGPTEEIWHRANRLANLKAIFLEATFPDEQARLADIAGHLTPKLFAGEVRKVNRPARFIAVHIKARFQAQVIAELQALALTGFETVRPGSVYRF